MTSSGRQSGRNYESIATTAKLLADGDNYPIYLYLVVFDLRTIGGLQKAGKWKLIHRASKGVRLGRNILQVKSMMQQSELYE